MTPRQPDQTKVKRWTDDYGSKVVSIPVEILTRKVEDGWAAALVIAGETSVAVYGARSRKAALEELLPEVGEAVVGRA